MQAASSFSQHMKKLVTGYRMAKENYLEERTMKDSVKVSKDIADSDVSFGRGKWHLIAVSVEHSLIWIKPVEVESAVQGPASS